MSKKQLNQRFLTIITETITNFENEGKSYRTLSLEDPGDKSLDKIVISDSRNRCDLVTFYNYIYYLKYILDTLLFEIFLRDDFILHTVQYKYTFPFSVKSEISKIKKEYYDIVSCLRNFAFFQDIQLLNTVLLFPYHFFTYLLFSIWENSFSNYGSVIIDAKKRTINQFRAIFKENITRSKRRSYFLNMLTFFKRLPEKIIIFDKGNIQIKIDIKPFLSCNTIFLTKDSDARVFSVPQDIERLEGKLVRKGKVTVGQKNLAFTSLYKLLNMIDDIPQNNLPKLFEENETFNGNIPNNEMKQIITWCTCEYIYSTFLNSDTDKIFLSFHEDFYRVGTVYLGMSRKRRDSLESKETCVLQKTKKFLT